MSEKNRKWIFYVVLAVSFIAILIYNVLTPLMSDELMYDTTAYQSLWDILKAEYNNYMTWNGRTVVQLIMRCFIMVPKWFFNICNSLCFILLTLLMYWNISNRKKYDFAALLLITLLIWQCGVSFDQTVLWLSGACNYLWGATIILGFATLFRYKCDRAEKVHHPVALAIGMFFFGIAGGWCNENTSGGGLLLVLFWAAIYYKKNKKLQAWMLTGICGMIVGLGFMVLAPGNRVRGALLRAEEEHSGVLAYVGRFLKINTAVETYLFGMLAVVIVLLTYFLIRKRKLSQSKDVIWYVFASLATAYVLVFTPQPMDRAYFGAGLFMMLALVQAIWYIPNEDSYLNAARYGGILVFLIFMFFVYCENGADLVRILRELNEREEYVTEQKAQGNYDLTVPMLRPEFQTKYSFIYKNDVDEDPDSWGCSLYRDYYGLNSLVGVPRDEWTEY